MTDAENNRDKTQEEEDFADLFEKSLDSKGSRWHEPGQKVTAQILKVTGEWIFIDIGQKGEGIIDSKEFLDLDGKVTVGEGDRISVYFLSSSHGEMRFTTKVGGGASGSAQLEGAWQSGIPVEGLVEKEIKGGYEVKLGGTARAFCPFSQIALRRIDDPASLIGTRLSFRIMEYGEHGRNIIVSRRVLLEEEQQRLREEAQAGISEGMRVNGTVTSLQPFGAFVDIGGLEGLVPLSELAWARVKDAAEVLSVGQQVQVSIKAIDRDKEKITLSLKDTLADPWDQVTLQFPEGSFHTGSVARLAAFGAFVTLAPGVDGLIHISKLGAGKRINHPREVLKEGESVEVKVESIDRAERRISLSLGGVARAAAEEEASLAEFRQQSTGKPAGMGTLGDLLAKAQKNRK
ncbi:30S ribosomal protein S1 [Geobacter sp. SVR]|uniref:30S ribosomal protein S1 n=1 Tax=Geobacter sp. SVR TaxID=2495594 RepID=UPI00143F0544|nr:30S ribosomal protein S1 [Geobacter sp. SVR]BCS53125.1 30S ribosomal protein S1 [Geobacter sp. SVR]GCF84510.1 30S ribosomal protein S1 [Geobacter sp. SVR]